MILFTGAVGILSTLDYIQRETIQLLDHLLLALILTSFQLFFSWCWDSKAYEKKKG
ncbi:hypothetical protein [Guptibacillus hwajinpoensis]|uniref:hypothetical protein n=1 Tax=Guptibacillus hwajinpoensis TaxID=208199 RepID=UPI003D0738B4